MSSALVAILSDCIVLCQRDVDGLLWSTGAAAAVVAVVVAAAPPPLDAMDAMVKRMSDAHQLTEVVGAAHRLVQDGEIERCPLRAGPIDLNVLVPAHAAAFYRRVCV